MQGVIILFGSWIIIKIIMFLPGLKEMTESVQTTGRARVLFLLPFFATFLGSKDAASLAGDLPGPLRLFRAIIYVIMFLYAFFFIMTRASVYRDSGKAIKFMLLYGFIAMLSSLWSVGSFVSLWKGFEVFSIVLSIMCISYYFKAIDDVIDIINVTSYYILYVLITVLVGLVLYPGKAMEFSESGSLMVNGIMPMLNSSSVGSFGAILFAMTFMKLFIVSDVKYSKTGIYAMMVISLAALLLAHSRTPIFACVIVIGIFLVISKRYVLVALLGSLASLLVIYASVSDVVSSYMLRGQTTQSFVNLTGRVHFWEKAWGSFLESPLLGNGFYAAQRLILGVSTVDNTYLEVLLGVGLIGCLIFIVPIIISILALFKTRPKKKNMSIISVAWLQSMALFSIIVLRSFTAPSFQVMHPLLVIYSVSIICIFAIQRISKENKL